jgi:hypothetical protein
MRCPARYERHTRLTVRDSLLYLPDIISSSISQSSSAVTIFHHYTASGLWERSR